MSIALDFQWDPFKADANLAKHQVSFALATTGFTDPWAITVYDVAHSDAEERWFTLGFANNGQLLAISHTYSTTGPASALVRLILARPASRTERKQYQDTPR